MIISESSIPYPNLQRVITDLTVQPSVRVALARCVFGTTAEFIGPLSFPRSRLLVAVFSRVVLEFGELFVYRPCAATFHETTKTVTNVLQTGAGSVGENGVVRNYTGYRRKPTAKAVR
ncbi:hypothetical protein [Natrinema caseinilyticum]|uniref:hypothetical protein n=1 Tax=Natrinema caseinilyticum TaxID=2961570 RepID=UPI0020C41645|nr:hypothetical protein [Natrinema caseinilyticum]